MQTFAQLCEVSTQTDDDPILISASTQTTNIPHPELVSATTQTDIITGHNSETQTVIDGPKIKGALTRVKELKDAADSDVIDIRPRCDQSPAEQSASHKLPMCASVQDPNTVPRTVEYGLPISNRFGHLIDELELSEQPESTVATETLHHIPSLKPKLLKPQRNPSRPIRSDGVNSDLPLPSNSTNSDRSTELPNSHNPTIHPRPVAVIIGDSIPRYLIGRRLSRRYRVVNSCIPGMTIQKLIQFVPLLIGEEQPAVIIVHCGTNNIMMHNTREIINLLSELDSTIKSLVRGVKVAFSGLTGNRNCFHTDVLICHINDNIKQFCQEHNSSFIDNSSLTLSHISRDGIHLNRRGIVQLAMNFIAYLRSTVRDDTCNSPSFRKEHFYQHARTYVQN
ncbi:hypothetical protein BSL78_06553 [Apostichopus japonicus]|uniref:SGNH hydrolase-type esterase domain-containing protein n=1 Tax=Stichopus japonicus TaxID=307972 RepID=A0A2G8L8F4_STIJA|nr:hypothetical protein BSL78_06553 [Apostichopus japonicus]